MNAQHKSWWLLLLAGLSLLGGSCREAPSQSGTTSVRQVGNVELIQWKEGDPRPSFRVDLQFVDADGNVKKINLPKDPNELKQNIRITEKASPLRRRGKDKTTPTVFYISHHSLTTSVGQDILMLFDVSGSMVQGKLADRSYLDSAKKAALGLLEGFRGGQDRIAIAPFESHDVKAKIEKVEFADRKERVQANLNAINVNPTGNTALFSATIFAAELLKKRKDADPARKYALIVLTDGKNDPKGDDPEVKQFNHQLAEVASTLNNSGVTAFGIGIGDQVNGKEMAAIFGAENYKNVKDHGALLESFTKTKEALAEQLSIAFYTGHQDYRKLRSLNFDVEIPTQEKQPVKGTINWVCPSASGCVPHRQMSKEESMAYGNGPASPPGNTSLWGGPLRLLLILTLLSGGLASLWFFIPKLIWPGPQLPKLTAKSELKPSRLSASPERPSTPAEMPSSVATSPRKPFEQTRVYEVRSQKNELAAKDRN